MDLGRTVSGEWPVASCQLPVCSGHPSLPLVTGDWQLSTASTTKVQLRLAWKCYRLVLNVPIGITSKSYEVEQAHSRAVKAAAAGGVVSRTSGGRRLTASRPRSRAPRWTAYDANFFNVETPEGTVMEWQDRTSASTIWYTAGNLKQRTHERGKPT